jgi:hypothetical protein
LVLAFVVGFGMFAEVRAEQWQRGDGHVAHTRLAPVLMHRAFPPYTGIHVYEGRSSGNRRGR